MKIKFLLNIFSIIKYGNLKNFKIKQKNNIIVCMLKFGGQINKKKKINKK